MQIPLTPRQLKICQYRYCDELPVKAIARKMGMSRSAVYWNLARVRRLGAASRQRNSPGPKRRTVRPASLSDYHFL